MCVRERERYYKVVSLSRMQPSPTTARQHPILSLLHTFRRLQIPDIPTLLGMEYFPENPVAANIDRTLGFLRAYMMDAICISAKYRCVLYAADVRVFIDWLTLLKAHPEVTTAQCSVCRVALQSFDAAEDHVHCKTHIMRTQTTIVAIQRVWRAYYYTPDGPGGQQAVGRLLARAGC